MTELNTAISGLKNSAYSLRLYNQRLVLIFLDKAAAISSVRWYDVAAKAWPILVADETPQEASLSKCRFDARRKLLDQARSKIMLALSKDLEVAEALLVEATELHQRATLVCSSGRFKGSVSALLILAGY